MSGYEVGPNLEPSESPWPIGWERSDEVKACHHDVWESVLTHPRYARMEECIRCRACHAPRCGHSTDPDPCMLVRHHRVHHVALSGGRRTARYDFDSYLSSHYNAHGSAG